MKKNRDKTRINATADFLEEFSWFIKKWDTMSLKDTVKLLRSAAFDTKSKAESLVGILPSLFLDEELFKSREDMLDFAESVLNIEIKRGNKSRNEYIGIIVCKVAKCDDENLSDMVAALEDIAADKEKIRQVKKAKAEPNFSWNDTIKRISNGEECN